MTTIQKTKATHAGEEPDEELERDGRDDDQHQHRDRAPAER